MNKSHYKKGHVVTNDKRDAAIQNFKPREKKHLLRFSLVSFKSQFSCILMSRCCFAFSPPGFTRSSLFQRMYIAKKKVTFCRLPTFLSRDGFRGRLFWNLQNNYEKNRAKSLIHPSRALSCLLLSIEKQQQKLLFKCSFRH